MLRDDATLRALGLSLLTVEWGRAAYANATARGNCSLLRGHERRGDVFTRIEEAMDSGSVNAEGMVLSAATDVTLLAEADAIVGGISTFSRLAVQVRRQV